MGIRLDVDREPSSRAVADVIGPMDAIFTPDNAPAPATATKFFTVEELVNVIHVGFRASTSRACAAASAGITVR